MIIIIFFLISGTSNTYRMTTKKKMYAQVPGLSSGDTVSNMYQPPAFDNRSIVTTEKLNYFDPTQAIEAQSKLDQPLGGNVTVPANIDNAKTILNTDLQLSHLPAYIVDVAKNTSVLEPHDLKKEANHLFSNINKPELSVKEEVQLFQPAVINKESSTTQLPSNNFMSNLSAPPIRDMQNIPPTLSVQSQPSTGQIIPPPPMFSSIPLKANQPCSTSVNKTILPPSIARRLISTQPVIKSSTVLTPCDVNIFVPTVSSETMIDNVNSVPDSIAFKAEQESTSMPTPVKQPEIAHKEEIVQNKNTVSSIFNSPGAKIFDNVQITENVPLMSNVSSVPPTFFTSTSFDTTENKTLPLTPTIPEPVITNSSSDIFLPPSHMPPQTEILKSVSEPPKMAPGAQNFRMAKKRPQYYSGPIEGIGSIGNNVKPIIQTTELPNAAYQGTFFTPDQTLTQPNASIEHNQAPSSYAFNQNRPDFDSSKQVNMEVNFQPPSYPTIDVTSDTSQIIHHPQTSQQSPQFNTVFDVARPTENIYEPPKQETKGFGIIGSLKSKLSSIDINKIQNSVTTFFDPVYNSTKVDNQQSQGTNAYGEHSYTTGTSNFEIFVPNMDISVPQYGTAPTYDASQKLPSQYPPTGHYNTEPLVQQYTSNDQYNYFQQQSQYQTYPQTEFDIQTSYNKFDTQNMSKEITTVTETNIDKKIIQPPSSSKENVHAISPPGSFAPNISNTQSSNVVIKAPPNILSSNEIKPCEKAETIPSLLPSGSEGDPTVPPVAPTFFNPVLFGTVQTNLSSAMPTSPEIAKISIQYEPKQNDNLQPDSETHRGVSSLNTINENNDQKIESTVTDITLPTLFNLSTSGANISDHPQLVPNVPEASNIPVFEDAKLYQERTSNDSPNEQITKNVIPISPKVIPAPSDFFNIHPSHVTGFFNQPSFDVNVENKKSAMPIELDSHISLTANEKESRSLLPKSETNNEGAFIIEPEHVNDHSREIKGIDLQDLHSSKEQIEKKVEYNIISSFMQDIPLIEESKLSDIFGGTVNQNVKGGTSFFDMNNMRFEHKETGSQKSVASNTPLFVPNIRDREPNIITDSAEENTEKLNNSGEKENSSFDKDILDDDPEYTFNICETCREVNKSEEQEAGNITTQMIENINAPIQLLNAVEVPFSENRESIENRGNFDNNQCAEITHITEETMERKHVKSENDFYDESDNNEFNYNNSKYTKDEELKNYDWCPDNVQQISSNVQFDSFNFEPNPNNVGFIGDTASTFANVNIPTNASDEIKAEYKSVQDDNSTSVILSRQMSVPSAPPAEDLDDTKSDSGILDVQLIEQDAKKDFPVYEQYINDPSETDDDKIECRERSKSLEGDLPDIDSFTNRVEKYKQTEEHHGSDKNPIADGVIKNIGQQEPIKLYECFPVVISPAVTIASYFDTGNYAAETHYKNLVSPSSSIPLNVVSPNQNTVYTPTLFSSDSHSVQDYGTDNFDSGIVTRNISEPFAPLLEGQKYEANIQTLETESVTSREMFSDNTVPLIEQMVKSIGTPFQDIVLANETVVEEEREIISVPAVKYFANIPSEQSYNNMSLPDPINFFSSHAPTNSSTQEPKLEPDTSFNRLASYFSSPAKTVDHSKSFFELSQGQDHFKQNKISQTQSLHDVDGEPSFFSSNQNDNLDRRKNQTNNEKIVSAIGEDKYTSNLQLMRDLTSYENFVPTTETVVKTVNYFDVFYDNNVLDKCNYNTETKEVFDTNANVTKSDELENDTYGEIEETFIDNETILQSIVNNCKYCCNNTNVHIYDVNTILGRNIFSGENKVRKTMDTDTKASDRKDDSKDDQQNEGNKPTPFAVNFEETFEDDDKGALTASNEVGIL